MNSRATPLEELPRLCVAASIGARIVRVTSKRERNWWWSHADAELDEYCVRGGDRRDRGANSRQWHQRTSAGKPADCERDFQRVPTDTGSAAVFLPTTTLLPNGLPSYSFDVSNVGGLQIFIDPVLAVGYDYTVGAGDPLFRSVVLPGDIGDGAYTLVLPNGETIAIVGGNEFF